MKNPLQTICFTKEAKIPLKALDRIRRQQAFAEENAGTFTQLSARELEVLTLIVQGHTTEDIGKRLYVSVHTIRTHRQNIRRQLGIHNVVEAVWWGQCFGLI